jgi:aminocarboxymuconate-semialdehyde decarboxylase
LTIAATRLIFSGVIERHPGLRLVLSHGGGTLPLGASISPVLRAQVRGESRMSSEHTKPPSHYLTRFYYDTIVGSPASLRFLIDVVGADRVIGTDFPYEIGDADGTIAIPLLQQLPSAQREKILGQNARCSEPRALRLSKRKPSHQQRLPLDAAGCDASANQH